MTRRDLRSSSGQMPAAAVVALAVALAAVVGPHRRRACGASRRRGSGTSAGGTPHADLDRLEPAPRRRPRGQPQRLADLASRRAPADRRPPARPPPAPRRPRRPRPPRRPTAGASARGGSPTPAARSASTPPRATPARETRSADLVLYVYVDGQLIATTTATVTDVPCRRHRARALHRHRPVEARPEGAAAPGRPDAVSGSTTLSARATRRRARSPGSPQDPERDVRGGCAGSPDQRTASPQRRPR